MRAGESWRPIDLAAIVKWAEHGVTAEKICYFTMIAGAARAQQEDQRLIHAGGPRLGRGLE